MIKSKHYISPLGNPVFYVDVEYEMLWEIGGCPHSYIHQIVQELEEVKNREREYGFLK